jgi:hypothetical protein
VPVLIEELGDDPRQLPRLLVESGVGGVLDGGQHHAMLGAEPCGGLLKVGEVLGG